MTTVTLFSQNVNSQFHSPQKPKGDCDSTGRIVTLKLNNIRSTHPKSRKAIVTSFALPFFCYHAYKFHSPQKPKGDCDRINRFAAVRVHVSSTHPKSRKAIVTHILSLLPFRMCNNCSTHPKSRKAIVTPCRIQSVGPSPQSSTHPKSRKAIVTASTSPRVPLNFQVPLTPKAERRL